jgi:hypothetical protein
VQAVVESPDFAADAKAAGLKDEDVRRVIEHLARHPDAGDLIPGTGGARKVRFAGRGKGKSGGYRVITYYAGASMPVFLLTVFGKGDKVNLTQTERNQLRKELAALADDYRKGVSDCVGGQAGCHGVWSRRMALRMIRSLRMQAVMATLAGRPKSIRRW